LTKKTMTLEIGEDYLILKKTPKCCIKDCDDYGTDGMCTLLMCKKHYDQGRD